MTEVLTITVTRDDPDGEAPPDKPWLASANDPAGTIVYGSTPGNALRALAEEIDGQ